jgi:regulator of replication initiation timing
VKEVQALKEELTRVAKDRSEQVDTQLQIEVTENLKLRQEIEQLRDILVRGNEEMRRLEASERESSRVIGERVFDIVKLSN